MAASPVQVISGRASRVVGGGRPQQVKDGAVVARAGAEVGHTAVAMDCSVVAVSLVKEEIKPSSALVGAVAAPKAMGAAAPRVQTAE